MPARARAFLDTSVLFSAVISETGGSRAVLQLGEFDAVQLVIGTRVLAEADGVLARKRPQDKVVFALMIDRSHVEIGPEPGASEQSAASAVVSYAPDARVLAEALAARVDYLVTLDRKHLLGNNRAASLPLLIGTPGDLLAWFTSSTGEGRDCPTS